MGTGGVGQVGRTTSAVAPPALSLVGRSLLVGEGIGGGAVVALMERIASVEEISKLGLGMAALVEEAPDDAWGVLAEGLVDDVAQGGPGGSDGEV